MRTLAGIVAYRPDIERLRENVAAVAPQVDQVIVFVNGDESYEAVGAAARGFEGVQLLKSAENLGIATGLARIMAYAQERGFDWVLTIDQDSVCRPGLVAEYLKHIDIPDVGMLTCRITDRNFSQDFASDGGPYQGVERCITAGSFTSVEAYSYTDGYDEQMFIDGVDWDICFNLRRHGYRIYRVNFDGVLQEVGHGRNVSLFGKPYVAYGESPLRNYYGARNDVYLARKYPEFVSMGKTRVREVRAEVIVLLYEEDKLAKLRNRWRGVRDGGRMPLPEGGAD
jgi:rhamnosyltransferase